MAPSSVTVLLQRAPGASHHEDSSWFSSSDLGSSCCPPSPCPPQAPGQSVCCFCCCCFLSLFSMICCCCNFCYYSRCVCIPSGTSWSPALSRALNRAQWIGEVCEIPTLSSHHPVKVQVQDKDMIPPLMM